MDQSTLTPKQQASEAIRQANSILVTTGQHPSTDQIAATLGLATILRKFGKKVTAIISDAVPQTLDFLPTDAIDKSLSGQRDFILKVDLAKTEVDSLKYAVEEGKLNIHITPFRGGFAPSDVTFAYGDYHYDLAIVVGVPTKARLDKVFEQNSTLFDVVPIVNFDFHRSNEQYGAINLIDPNAASLCEMLVALSESLQTGLIDAELATVLLTGIIASTDRFTATHTTSKSLTVAAQMMAAGADQQKVVRGLYRSNQSNGDSRGRGDRGGRGGSRSSELKSVEAAKPANKTIEPTKTAAEKPAEPVKTPVEPISTPAAPISENPAREVLPGDLDPAVEAFNKHIQDQA